MCRLLVLLVGRAGGEEEPKSVGVQLTRWLLCVCIGVCALAGWLGFGKLFSAPPVSGRRVVVGRIKRLLLLRLRRRRRFQFAIAANLRLVGCLAGAHKALVCW